MRNIVGLRTLWTVLLLSLAIAVAAACTDGGDDGAGDAADAPADAAVDAAVAERLQVVASTGIIAHFAEQIAGDDADVVSVIPPGADAHTFSPTTAAIRAVSAADLVIVNGYNLEETTLGTIFEQLRDDAVLVVATTGITPLEGGHHHHEHEGHDDHDDEEGHHDEDENGHDHDEDEEGHGHDEDEDEHGHDEDEDEHGHDHDEDEEGHGHDEDEDEHGHDEDEDEHGHDHDEDEHGHDEDEEEEGHDDKHIEVADEHRLAVADGDPHMWLTVPNAMVYVRNIANAIVAADPANAAAYREREEAYLAELEKLDEEVRATIARIPPDSRVLIVYHDAFQYFSAEYGLELAAALLPGNPSQQASASAVAEIIEIVGGRQVGAVYREPQFAAEAIEAIAEEAGRARADALQRSVHRRGGHLCRADA